MIKSISIIGCGWLGFPLATQLIALGFQVHGSTTNEKKMSQLADAGILPYVLDLNKPINEQLNATGKLFSTDLLILAIPPRVRKYGNNYGIDQIRNLLAQSPNGNMIYTSSTAVYPSENRTWTEADIDLTKIHNLAHPILRIENTLSQQYGDKLTILRLGGLFGYDRIPIKYFLGKMVKNGGFPVNYLHQNDAVNSIIAVINNNVWGELYNIVSPNHPMKKEILLKNAQDLGLEKPKFSAKNEGNYKIISGNKFIRDLGFTFQYPDPLLYCY